MLDIRWIRDNADALDLALYNRRAEPQAQALIALDEQRRSAISLAQTAQEERNKLSKEIGFAKAAKNEALTADLLERVSLLKSIGVGGEKSAELASQRLDDALARIPNVPLDEVPVGDETANAEVRTFGAVRELPEAKEHFELGEALGQMDFEAAAEISGSRFVVLKAGLARLERALGQFMLDLHTEEHGYTEVQPPILVKDQALFGTAQLPKFKEDQFSTVRLAEGREHAQLAMRAAFGQAGRIEGIYSELDQFETYFDQEVLEAFEVELWLIPTAEVPLTNLVREQILAAADLPLRYTALTPCFRSEAGSAGRDTRGMLRQHQFNKVELVSITAVEQSADEHERMTACAEEVLKRLGLAYRVMLLSTGDMGFASRKTYDLEVWLPGQKAYREISSCSTCGDFQARRMQARYRAEGVKQPLYVHTLNGSGVAVGRALIAVMETYQNPDGSITVPEVLRPYMRGVERIG